MAYKRIAELVDKAIASKWFLLAFLLLTAIGLRFSVDETNIAISILTAAAVFLTAGSQRRHARAVQGKLDELIKCLPGARDEMLRAEDREEYEIEGLRV